MKKLKTRVPQETYSKEYYLADEYAGASLFKNKSESMVPQLERIYRQVKPTKKGKFLDAGCGKGELLYFMSKKGYQVYGVDYARASIKLTSEYLRKKKVEGIVKQADVRDVPFEDDYFDVIISEDVIEHLDNEKASLDFLNEAYRVLKPGGKFYLHTAPNKLFLECYFKYIGRWLNALFLSAVNLFLPQKRKFKVNLSLRTPTDEVVHINEQTYFTLKRVCRSSHFRKFSITIVADPLTFSLLKAPYYILVYLFPLNKVFPLSIILGNHLYVTLEK
ncbi:MAG: methyltransferase domain-containing protein [Patescibacteria group bacterium]|jgi:2-polyprenyl-3-methyl-5-hydroxy-6-metoxy-1,4-benzoquinol methylase